MVFHFLSSFAGNKIVDLLGLLFFFFLVSIPFLNISVHYYQKIKILYYYIFTTTKKIQNQIRNLIIYLVDLFFILENI
jgi:hypothetical protein